MRIDSVPVDKMAVATMFGHAAHSYEHFAQFQRYCGEKLLHQLPCFSQLQILDAGCGTGYFSRCLRQQGHQVIALDLAIGMLAQARAQQSAQYYLLADLENIPLRDVSVDLCFCNLALQWCSSLPGALTELYRVVRPGGKVLFSTLSQGSLCELAQTYLTLDGKAHVNNFLPIQEIRQACAPFDHQLMMSEEKQYFPNVDSLLKMLKRIGATHLHRRSHVGLGGRQRLARLKQLYPHDSQGCALSYQLVIGVLESG